MLKSIAKIAALSAAAKLAHMVYLELRKPAPDGARIGRLMKFYIRMMAVQGVTQIAMIVVMARFVAGL